MKKIKYIIGALVISACMALGLESQAGTYYVSSTAPVLSTAGAVTVTNGLYPTSIAQAGTITSLAALNAGNTVGNTMVLSLTAQGNAANLTNAVFVISSGNANNPVTITNTATGAGYSTQARGVYTTITLPLNGTTQVTTNIVLSPSSTPPFNGGMKLYLESVAMGVGAASLTNYSLIVSQQ